MGIHHSRVAYVVAFTGLLSLVIFAGRSVSTYIADAGKVPQLAAVDASDPALVGWWKFDEGSGSTAADSSASGHSGTVNGTPSWVTGKVGSYALNFDGTSNSVETTAPSSLSGSSVFTVTFWAKPATLTNGAAVSIRSGTTDDNSFNIVSVSPQGGYGPMVSWPANSTLIKGSNSSLADGNWHFYAFVSRSATDHELFVDGASAGVSNASRALPSGLTNITIGAKYSQFGGAGFHNGPIDDLRVFSRALTSGELSTLYGSGGSSQSQPPVQSGDTTAPSAPTGLTATAVSSSQINLTWTASTDNVAVAGYKIFRNNSQVGTTAATSYSDTGLSASTQYSYTVSAYDTSSNPSLQSSSASATTQASSGGGGNSGGGNASGGPGAGAHTIYVDQNLTNDCAGTYSVALRNCSGSDGYAYNTAQEGADASSPGNTVMFRGGTYHSVCIINQCSSIIINNSGTSGNLITYESYPNENAVFYGLGFSDADANHDGYADGPNNDNYREQLVYVHGNYLDLKNFEVTNAEGTGLWVDGSNDIVENIYAHDNWADNIDLGFNVKGALVENDIIRNVESAYSHHGAGIGYGTLRQTGVQPIKNITIEDSLTYGNGFYLLNGVVTRVLPTGSDTEGGGNSWGIVADDSCSNFILSGYDSGCPGVLIKGVVSWTNVDSSFVPEGDTLLLNNIAFDNGWEGDGLKVFDYVPNLSIVGNIVYHNRDRGVEIRSAGGGLFANNTVIDNGGFGIWGGDQGLYNNISWENDPAFSSNPVSNNSFCLNGEDCTNNLVGIDPQFYNEKPFQDSSGNIVVNLPTGMTIAQKVQWMKDQFHNSFSVKPGSPAIDMGKTYSYVDPVSGIAYSSSYYGAAPDAGAYEYQVGQIINPPAQIQDTTPPSLTSITVSSIASTSAVVTWNTNENSDTQIDYGLTSSYTLSTSLISTPVTVHTQTLTGLTPNTLYHYHVKSRDSSNNLGVSGDGTFSTLAANATSSQNVPVNNPPANTGNTSSSNTASGGNGGGGGGGGGGGSAAAALPTTLSVSNIRVSGSFNSGLTITWTSNNPSSSQINYGLTTAYGSQTAFDQTLTTSHSQKLTGLKLNSIYHLQVRSKDSQGNLASSGDVVLVISSAGAISLAVPTTSTATSGGTVSSNQGFVVSVVGSITKPLYIGVSDSQVRILQQILNAKGYRVAVSGAGSPGNESTYFGPATQAALEKFQCANGIICSGTPGTTGYGSTGPKTRALLGGSTVTTSSQSQTQTAPIVQNAGSITKELYLGLIDSQVKTLQQILNSKGFTVAFSGNGSSGHETTVFGPATQTALEKFQCLKLGVCSGSPLSTGYGGTGPKTRAALNQ